MVEQLLRLAELSRKMRFRQGFWEAQKRKLASLQQFNFAQELSHLRTFKGKELLRIKELSLFLCGDGLIRCNTRLHEAKFLSYDAKNSILLPASDHLSDLIIQKYHHVPHKNPHNFKIRGKREKFCFGDSSQVTHGISARIQKNTSLHFSRILKRMCYNAVEEST